MSSTGTRAGHKRSPRDPVIQSAPPLLSSRSARKPRSQTRLTPARVVEDRCRAGVGPWIAGANRVWVPERVQLETPPPPPPALSGGRPALRAAMLGTKRALTLLISLCYAGQLQHSPLVPNVGEGKRDGVCVSVRVCVCVPHYSLCHNPPGILLQSMP